MIEFIKRIVFSWNFLFLVLVFLMLFYLIYLVIRDYRINKQAKYLHKKIAELIAGDYSESLSLKGSPEMSELFYSVNRLSEVLRLTHENLAQEKNRLAGVLSYMSDGVFATDRNGKIILINAMAKSQLGLSGDEALGLTIMDILGEENTYTYQELLSKTPELVISRQNEYSEWTTLKVNLALLKRESGFISGLVVVLHDTTEQEKEERERRLFVSNVSHELRTPLTSVKSYLEALDEGALLEPVAPQFIRVSLDETNRMMRMISDLLNLSRIDNDRSQADMEMTNFTAFMTYVLNRFDQIKSQQTVAGKRYDLVRDYQISPIWIEIDTDKMTQVLDNILNNAIKYSPDGGKITVSMKTTDTQLIISISDEGLGIPKKDLPLIFDRFYRVDKARSRAQGGTGLGLAIAKEIIKQHKGFIWAKSDYGKGSTFTIVLPYERESSLEDWDEEEE